MRVMCEDDPADIAVTLEVHRNLDNGSRHEVNEIWVRTYDRVPLASAQLAGVIAEVRASLTAGFGETQRRGHHYPGRASARRRRKLTERTGQRRN
jgi:hypothetical protein